MQAPDAPRHGDPARALPRLILPALVVGVSATLGGLLASGPAERLQDALGRSLPDALGVGQVLGGGAGAGPCSWASPSASPATLSWPGVHPAVGVATGVSGVLLAIARQGWVSLFTVAVPVASPAVIAPLCIVSLPAWLLDGAAADAVARRRTAAR